MWVSSEKRALALSFARDVISANAALLFKVSNAARAIAEALSGSTSAPNPARMASGFPPDRFAMPGLS